MARPLTELAAQEQLAPLWKAVHERLCRGGATDRSLITVPGASPDTRRAVDRLLGRVSAAGRLQLRFGDLERALQTAGTDTNATVTASVGPVVDRTVARAAARTARSSTWAEILGHPAAAEAALKEWLDAVRTGGRLERAGGVHAILGALDVLAVLPRSGTPVGRPVLAATILGDEHALDDSEPAGRLVTAGLAARLGVPTPTSSSERGELWASVGVSIDAVSTPALTLGLRPLAAGPLTEAARRWADGGVPLPIPAAALTAEPWIVEKGTLVFVCENPSVLEAVAATFGPAAAPLICVSGMPGRAVTALLSSLDTGGARLRYHGDFGSGGLTIANLVIRRHHAEPWRMTTADHRLAVERLSALGRRPNRLRGRVPTASWDGTLAEHIVAYRHEITEEHVLDDLLSDLRR